MQEIRAASPAVERNPAAVDDRGGPVTESLGSRPAVLPKLEDLVQRVVPCDFPELVERMEDGSRAKGNSRVR